MTTMHRRPHVLAALVAFGLLAACSGGNEVADLTTVAPAPSTTESAAAPTTTEAPAIATTDAATTVPETTEAAPVTTVAVDGLTGPMFSDALGVQVDDAPGVRTRGDTRQLLPEGLYVHIAWEPDPQDPSVFTVQPDDVEILEAYANAVTTYYRAALTTLTLDDPDFARYYIDAGAKYADSFGQARDGGFALSLGSGVVLRPYVLGDQRTDVSAVVLDCYLQDQAFFRPADGTPSPSDLETSPTIATMVLVDGEWKADVVSTEPSACL